MNSTYQLTACQRDVWVANSHFPHLPQFNVFIYDRISGDVSDDELRSCLADAADRNVALRLQVAESDGIPYQWPAPTAPAVRMIDLSGSADPRQACERWLREAFDTPFLATRSPLVQLAVIRESPKTAYVYVKSLHILNDAWSLNLIMAQFRQNLAALRTGAVPDHAAPSYLDAISADQRYRGSAEWQAAQDYFREHLAGLEPALYHRRDEPGNRRSARHQVTIERALIEQIRGCGYSVFAFVTAALCAYLSRVHRTDDVCVGVPLLNRTTPEQRLMVGHFANTLPLRVNIGQDQSFAELVSAVHALTRNLKTHERLAVGDLLAALPGGHGPKRLFDVTIAYLRWPTPQPISGLRYDTVVQARAHDDDALGIVVNELDDTSDVRVDLDYGCDVFDGDYSIEDFGRHLHNLLRNALLDLAHPAHRVDMLDPAERRALVEDANRTRTPYDRHTTLHAQFRAQAARSPEAVALIDDATGQRLTYRELDSRSDKLAAVLRADGVRAEDPVAILLERSPQLMVAILAVLKAGGAYLPIDPGYPRERIEFMLRDSGSRVLIHDARTALELDTGATLRRDLSLPLPDLSDGLSDTLRRAARHRRRCQPRLRHLHLGIDRPAEGRAGRAPLGGQPAAWMQQRYPVGADDVLLQKTPVSFDVSVWELFWWALAGARVVLLARGGEGPDASLARASRATRVTVAHFVPSMLGPFLDLAEAATVAKPGDRPALRVLQR